MEAEAFNAVMELLQANADDLPSIVWPGSVIPAPSNAGCIVVSWAGNSTAPHSVCGGGGRHRFLLTLLVKLPSGSLYGEAIPYLDALRAIFPAGFRFGPETGRLTSLAPVDVRLPYTADGWYTIPVLVSLQAIT